MISIYALINPLDNKVFYVGASMNPSQRLSHHCTVTYQGTYKDLIVEKIIKRKKKPELLILDIVSYEEAAYYEDFYLSLFKSWGFTLRQDRSNYKGGMLSNFQKRTLPIYAKYSAPK